jgi:hypothetical protein
VYHLGNQVAAVAMDYPFNGFHDSTICYRTTGWTILDSKTLSPSGDPQREYYSIAMSKPPVTRGQLLFGLFDEHGVAAMRTPPVPDQTGRLGLALLLSRQKAEALPTYQVQTLSIGVEPLTGPQLANVRALFLAARDDLARQLLAHLGGKP